MSFLSQSNRTAVLTTPLGSDDLIVQSVEGVDEISQLFAFDLTLLADASNDINFSSILGKSISLSFDDGSGTLRYISGISTQFSQAEQVGASQSLPALCRYRMRMQPKLWTLGLSTNCMIYENRTPAQVIESVLKNASIEYSLKLSNPSAKRVYIVQFNETDLAFISRLMEEEGLSYYFKFAKGSHEMIITDNPSGNAIASPGAEKLTYTPQLPPDSRLGPVVTKWRKSQKLVSVQSTLMDYQFQQADKSVLGNGKPKNSTVNAGKVSHSLTAGNFTNSILTGYPALPAHHLDAVNSEGNKDSSALGSLQDLVNNYAALDIARATADAVSVDAVSLSAAVQAGSKFSLKGHFNGDGDYLITRVTLKFDQSANLLPSFGGSSVGEFVCESEFHAVPLTANWVPQLRTPKPRIDGLMSAQVIATTSSDGSSSGGSGGSNDKDPILTDQFARIKVQFHWATKAKSSDGQTTSSCWIRYAQPWAGNVWGSLSIPRDGQEVMVAFEQGDPDRPVALASVYNSLNMPPFELPVNKNYSGLKTSTPTGSADQFSGLAFNDTKGSEEVRLHSERNMTIQVENSSINKVGGTFYKTVAGNSFERFGGKFQASNSGSGGGDDSKTGTPSKATEAPGDYWKNNNAIEKAEGEAWKTWEQAQPPGLSYRGTMVYGSQLASVVGVDTRMTLGDSWSIVMAPAGLQAADMTVSKIDDMSDATGLPGSSPKALPGETSIVIGATHRIGVGTNSRFDQGSSVQIMGTVKSATDSVNSGLKDICSKAAANVVSAASTDDSFSDKDRGTAAGSLVGLSAESLLGGLVGNVVTSALNSNSAVTKFAGVSDAANPLTGQARSVSVSSATSALSNSGSALADMVSQMSSGVTTKISHNVQLAEGTTLIGSGQSILLRSSADTNVFPNCGGKAGTIALIAEGVPGGSPSGSLVMMGGELFSLGTAKNGDKFAHICANSDGQMFLDSGSSGAVQINAANADQNMILNTSQISLTTNNKPIKMTTSGGELTITTSKGEVSINTTSGAINIKSSSGAITIDSGTGNLNLKGNAISIKATQGVSIQGMTFEASGQTSATMKNASGNSLELSASGATLKGLNTSVEANVQHSVKGLMIEENGSAMAKRNAGITMD